MIRRPLGLLHEDIFKNLQKSTHEIIRKGLVNEMGRTRESIFSNAYNFMYYCFNKS